LFSIVYHPYTGKSHRRNRTAMVCQCGIWAAGCDDRFAWRSEWTAGHRGVPWGRSLGDAAVRL